MTPRRGLVAPVLLVLLGGRLAGAADPCATLAGSVAGTVVEASGGTPIAGVRVRVQGCLGEPVLTDAGGAFSLPVPAGPVVVTAAADNHFIGCWQAGAGAGCSPVQANAGDLRIALEPVAAVDDPAYVFRDPGTCAPCHQEIVDQWSRSTKAHTNRNLWVDNLYNGGDVTLPPGPLPDPTRPPFYSFLKRHNPENPRHPTRFGECANCHQPEYVGTNPTNTDFNAFAGTAQHGVGCDFCHRIVNVDTTPAGLPRPNLVPAHDGAPAKTTMLRTPLVPALVLGPLDDVTYRRDPDMRAVHATILRSSRLCASCHEDSTDPQDSHGNFTGTYSGPPSQTTYSEWLASPYAAQGVECQDCHMPPSGSTRMCSEAAAVQRDQRQIRSHVFEGTTPDFLRRAVKLGAFVTIGDADTLSVQVDVSNVGAGHDIPTGVTLRNLILLVSAADKSGTALDYLDKDKSDQTIPNWGGIGDPAAGNFAGLPGKGYARVLLDTRSFAENVLFTDATASFDNRIKAGATDTSTYHFQLPKDWRKRDVRIATRLYFRRAFKPLADERKWNRPVPGGNAHGTRGDGGDYDESFVMAEARNFLTCRGKLAKLRATVAAGSNTADISATLTVPRGASLDPRRNGVGLTLAGAAGSTGALQEQLSDFTVSGRTIALADTSGPVRGLTLTQRGARGYRLALRVPAEALAQTAPALGIDSGDVCFRKALRCKRKHAALVCR